jgi:hypothetical protein
MMGRHFRVLHYLQNIYILLLIDEKMRRRARKWHLPHIKLGEEETDEWNNYVNSLSSALLEKLPVTQLLKNSPTFYETRKFIIVFT